MNLILPTYQFVHYYPPKITNKNYKQLLDKEEKEEYEKLPFGWDRHNYMKNRQQILRMKRESIQQEFFDTEKYLTQMFHYDRYDLSKRSLYYFADKRTLILLQVKEEMDTLIQNTKLPFVIIGMILQYRMYDVLWDLWVWKEMYINQIRFAYSYEEDKLKRKVYESHSYWKKKLTKFINKKIAKRDLDSFFRQLNY